MNDDPFLRGVTFGVTAPADGARTVLGERLVVPDTVRFAAAYPEVVTSALARRARPRRRG